MQKTKIAIGQKGGFLLNFSKKSLAGLYLERSSGSATGH